MITLTIPAADGDSDIAQDVNLPWGTVDAYGDFDDGTLTLYYSPDGGTTWIAMTDEFGSTLAFSASGYANFHRSMEKTVRIKATLAGSSGATSVTLQIREGFAPTRESYVAG